MKTSSKIFAFAFAVVATALVPTSRSFARAAADVPFPTIAASSDYLPTDSKLNRAEDATLDETRARFAEPGADFATAPLWVWNDLLTDAQIRATLQDLAGQGVKQAFVHPRPGLATPYLSDEWFRLWNVALDEARGLGMKIWIYDENSYPSGFAGGFVPDALPNARGTGLDVAIYDSLEQAADAWQSDDSILCVVEELADGAVRDRTPDVLAGTSTNFEQSPNAVRWVVARLRRAQASQWFGGKTYVNLLTPGVLDAFVHFTHARYREFLGDEFGRLIPGAFTDEPQIASAGTFSWTEDFPQEFEKRRGYSILSKLSSLVAPIGDWKKIRYDYYRTTLELFVERWHRPLAAYCERNGLEYTGHDWEHEWPNARACPDNMATAFWRQRPAIDLLMNNFSRSTHSQFGNVRSVRELSSIVRQSGRSRALSENYGAGGYDLRFEDMKRLGDWSYALGVNATDEHLSYITIRGARKHDHPQTFSYHSSWFAQYSKMESYWTRLSYLLSRGKLSDERFLLLEPTTTAWFYQQNAGDESNKLEKIGNEFADLLNKLEAAQLDYDLGSEDVISRIASVCDDSRGVPALKVGAANYLMVVLPPNLENLDEKTFALLAEFTRKGGRVVSLGANVERVAGTAAAELAPEQKDAFKALIQKIDVVSFDELSEEISACAPVAVVAKSNADNVFHMTRQTSDSRIVFLCNVDMNDAANVEIDLNDDWTNAGIEIFDPQTGARRPAFGTAFELSPCGSLALVISNQIEKRPAPSAPEPFRIDPWKFAERVSVKPLDDNVLVLDYMTLKSGGETLDDEYFYRANAWLWRKNGFETSPWDNGVQFQDELLRREFSDDSGFEVSYKFVKSDAEIPDLRFVVENPDDYKVYCNGTALEKIPGAWKFDRSFGVFDVAKLVRPGENEMRLVAKKMTIFCELMPAWIVGSFSLEPRDVGFEIVADKGLRFNDKTGETNAVPDASSERELVPTGWASQGRPFYSGAVDYSLTLEKSELPSDRSILFGLPGLRERWNGAVAAILVDDEQVGSIAFPNETVDLTNAVKNATQTKPSLDLTIRVYGTPKNQFGPHHAGKLRGSAWPGSFHGAPATRPSGSSYDVIEYGLFPF